MISNIFQKDALPVIEVAHEGAFLTKPMYQSLETGDFNKVPLFIGGNSEEFITLADSKYIPFHFTFL